MANVIETALVSFLLQDAGVNAIVGNRISPMVTEQNVASPRITYERISTTPLFSNNGPSQLTAARTRISCWGQGDLGYSTAKSLANAVRNATGGNQGSPCSADFAALNGFRGTMNGVPVKAAFIEDERDEYWPPRDNQDIGDYQTVLDLMIWWLA